MIVNGTFVLYRGRFGRTATKLSFIDIDVSRPCEGFTDYRLPTTFHFVTFSVTLNPGYKSRLHWRRRGRLIQRAVVHSGARASCFYD